MAESGIGLGVEELTGPARVAVCGLRVERGRVVLNQRLGPIGPPQRIGIKAVLELEDERPVRSDGLDALTPRCDCPSPFGTIVYRDPLLFFEMSVSTPFG
jgi:hypothetical protein